MTGYEQLLNVSDAERLIIKEKLLSENDGLIYNNRIAICNNISTTKEKACVLAEELGHYYTTAGDIINLHDANNQKQELRARVWGYNKLIGLVGIVQAFEHGCRNNRYEMVEYLNVTEKYLDGALNHYKIWCIYSIPPVYNLF